MPGTERAAHHSPMRQEKFIKPSERHRGEPPGGAERPLWPALRRGWAGRCPDCGGGPLFEGYLKVRSRCASCGAVFHHHRADDLPAWATILIVAHVVVLGFFHVQMSYAPPMWLNWAVWPALALGLTMWLLPRVKGAVVALQWAKRMHGFGGEGSDD